MLKFLLNPKTVFAALVGRPPVNHARQLAMFVYDTLGGILKINE